MDEEGKTFERRATVLERNPFWRALSLALLVLGPLAFAAAAAKLFPPGIFGLHATVVGLGVLLTQRRHNHSPQRTERVVRAAPEGVFVDGEARRRA